MRDEDYQKRRETLLALADEVSLNKRKEYTGNDQDVLKNFKRIATRLDITPLHVWSVYFNKHVDSVNTYIKDEGEVSESMDSRFSDLLNYLFLGYALIKEKEEEEARQNLFHLPQKIAETWREGLSDEQDVHFV
jgi:hypothetical protein